jgi:CRISPR system Cascade subunit CasC
MFVQIHTLRDYSTALPNRGQDGLAKRTVYGGIERQRISSQSFKAALRDCNSLVRANGDGSPVPDNLCDLASSLGLSMSVRSALIGDRKVKPKLMAKGLSDEQAQAWSEAIMGLWRAEEAKADSNQPIVIGEMEIDFIVDAALAIHGSGGNAKALRELFEKDSALRKAPEAAQQAVKSLRAMRAHAGIDGALFGRFATGVAVSNVDSAVHVAHLVTVHPLFSVTDFFSVQDLLKTGNGDDRGGSHINTTELTSGLFYGYVVVDLRQLESNFTTLSAEQRSGIVGWLVRAVAQVEPAAKLGSTAPYAGLRELMVEVGRRQPRTLIGAFERPTEPTQSKTLSDVARERLEAHAREMDDLMGAPAFRRTMHAFKGNGRPAVEVIADETAKQLLA